MLLLASSLNKTKLEELLLLFVSADPPQHQKHDVAVS
jgi:hypothetical protein